MKKYLTIQSVNWFSVLVLFMGTNFNLFAQENKNVKFIETVHDFGDIKEIKKIKEDELDNILFGPKDKKLDNVALDRLSKITPYDKFDPSLVKLDLENKYFFDKPDPVKIEDYRTQGLSIPSESKKVKK